MAVKKKVEAHVLEKVIVGFMIIFGIAAFIILFNAISLENPDPNLAVIEILIILILAVFAQTFILVRLHESIKNLNNFGK